MPRMSSDAVTSRQRILSTALALFREKGFAGTSIRDIAEQLNVSKAALYYHFASKEDLLDAVITPALVKVAASLETAQFDTPAQRRAALDQFVAALAEIGPDLVGLMRDPAAEPFLRDRVADTRLPERWQEQLARGVAGPAPSERRLADARLRAGFVMAGIPGAIDSWIEHHDTIPAEVIELIAADASLLLEKGGSAQDG